MASDILDRVGMVITDTGTGDVTANVLISTRFNTPAEAGAVNGGSYWWMLEEESDYEIFEGVYTAAGTKVARSTVWQSKIAGVHGTTKMTLAGNATLRSITPAELFDAILRFDKSQSLSTGQKTQALTNLGFATVGKALAAAVDAAAARSALSAVNQTGDTISGPLKLKQGTGASAIIPLEIGWGNEAGSRWRIGLSTSQTLQWGRYDSSGSWISTPIEMAIDYTQLTHGTAAADANVFRLGWTSASYPHWQWWLLATGGISLAYHSPTTGLWQINAFDAASTGVTFNVPISKPSGTFLIDHPLDPTNKDLAHAFIEGPRNDLLYRGDVTLVAGRATVDIDAASDMSSGTFAALTTNARVMALQNQDGFARLRPGSITNGVFEIVCEDEACTDTVSWLVAAERNDPYVREVDPNCSRDGLTKGRFIVEREKPDFDGESA